MTNIKTGGGFFKGKPSKVTDFLSHVLSQDGTVIVNRSPASFIQEAPILNLKAKPEHVTPEIVNMIQRTDGTVQFEVPEDKEKFEFFQEIAKQQAQIIGDQPLAPDIKLPKEIVASLDKINKEIISNNEKAIEFTAILPANAKVELIRAAITDLDNPKNQEFAKNVKLGVIDPTIAQNAFGHFNANDLEEIDLSNIPAIAGPILDGANPKTRQDFINKPANIDKLSKGGLIGQLSPELLTDIEKKVPDFVEKSTFDPTKHPVRPDFFKHAIRDVKLFDKLDKSHKLDKLLQAADSNSIKEIPDDVFATDIGKKFAEKAIKIDQSGDNIKTSLLAHLPPRGLHEAFKNLEKNQQNLDNFPEHVLKEIGRSEDFGRNIEERQKKLGGKPATEFFGEKSIGHLEGEAADTIFKLAKEFIPKEEREKFFKKAQSVIETDPEKINKFGGAFLHHAVGEHKGPNGKDLPVPPGEHKFIIPPEALHKAGKEFFEFGVQSLDKLTKEEIKNLKLDDFANVDPSKIAGHNDKFTTFAENLVNSRPEEIGKLGKNSHLIDTSKFDPTKQQFIHNAQQHHEQPKDASGKPLPLPNHPPLGADGKILPPLPPIGPDGSQISSDPNKDPANALPPPPQPTELLPPPEPTEPLPPPTEPTGEIKTETTDA